jgi:glycosyltransferase involved in cell wall biosynthesis
LYKYDALLFPTYWAGEGFPGTIIDAFASGLPVVATDWNCNNELIDNKRTGILYPNGTEQNLEEAIDWLYRHQKEMLIMRRNCLKEAYKYMPDVYISKMIKKIEGLQES